MDASARRSSADAAGAGEARHDAGDDVPYATQLLDALSDVFRHVFLIIVDQHWGRFTLLELNKVAGPRDRIGLRSVLEAFLRHYVDVVADPVAETPKTQSLIGLYALDQPGKRVKRRLVREFVSAYPAGLPFPNLCSGGR